MRRQRFTATNVRMVALTVWIEDNGVHSVINPVLGIVSSLEDRSDELVYDYVIHDQDFNSPVQLSWESSRNSEVRICYTPWDPAEDEERLAVHIPHMEASIRQMLERNGWVVHTEVAK